MQVLTGYDEWMWEIDREAWASLNLPRERAQLTLYIKPLPKVLAQAVLSAVVCGRRSRITEDVQEGSVNVLYQVVIEDLDEAALFFQFQGVHTTASKQQAWETARRLPGGDIMGHCNPLSCSHTPSVFKAVADGCCLSPTTRLS